MKKILVIEDTAKHLQDAKNFFSSIEGVEVTFQQSYEPFSSMTRNNTPDTSDNFQKYDGVISDIYFPQRNGSEIQPIGVSILFQCKMLNVPCVLCTGGYHHGSQYDWINEMCIALTSSSWSPVIVDGLDGKDIIPKAQRSEKGDLAATKGWEKAWQELQKQF